MPQSKDIIRPGTLKVIESICNIDSRTALSPDGATHVARIVGHELESLGFTCEEFPCDTTCGPRGHHLVAIRNPQAKPGIVLMGHSDTVLGPGDVPFRYDESAGRLYGAGVADMKGGLILMVEAIRLALAEGGAVSQAGLKVIINATEESSTEASIAFLRESCRDACACLNFEPGLRDPDGTHILPSGRKGMFRARLDCAGMSAHAGNAHHSGVSAIRELARKVEIIESVTDYDREVTANVGTISGGRVSNQVPDLARIQFEIRCYDPKLMQSVVKDLLPSLTEPTLRSADGEATTSLSLERGPGFPPYPPNPATEELLNRYAKFAEETGFRTGSRLRGGASDLNFVADLAPALDGLGIIGWHFHNPAEWADLHTFGPRVRATAALLRDICERPPASLPGKKAQ